jgi:hypothetical protein
MRRPDPFPPDPPLRPPVPAYRVKKRFSIEGRIFEEGRLLSLDCPLAQAIHREHPEYLQPTRR